MESAESCLVVSDLLHGSGSTRSHLCRSGAVLGQGVLLPQEGSLATWAGGSAAAQGWIWDRAAVRWLRPGCGACAALYSSFLGASTRMGGMGPGLGSGRCSAWCCWPESQISCCIPPKPQVRSIHSHPSASAFWRMQPGVLGVLCHHCTPDLACELGVPGLRSLGDFQEQS